MFQAAQDQVLTPEQIRKRQAIADSLRQANNRTPQNVGEGIHAVARALAGRAHQRSADQGNKTLKWLSQNAPAELTQQVSAGQISPLTLSEPSQSGARRRRIPMTTGLAPSATPISPTSCASG